MAESTRLRVAVTTGPVSIPPTYFVVNHLLRMPAVDGRLFALSAQVNDPEVTPIVESVTPHGVPGLRGVAAATAAVPRLRRAVREFRPDIVHQHFGTWSLAGAGAARDLGVPFLATLHGYDVFRYDDPIRDYWTWITARNLRTCARDATVLLTVSEWLAGQAVRVGFPAAKIDVHYQGADTDFFVPPALDDPRKAAQEPPQLLFLSAFEPTKGVRDAIAASVALLPTVPHTLHLVGSGSQQALVDAAAAEHPHITVGGPRDRAGVRATMQAADVLLLPTQRQGRRLGEPAGLVILEAQACGTPVVIYRSGGAPEMLDDGATGLVVEECNVAALADALGAILTLPDAERKAMSAAARKFVVEKRSIANSATELQARYTALTQ